MHMVGVKAEKYIKEAQENIAKILKVESKGDFLYIQVEQSQIICYYWNSNGQ